MPRCTLCLAPGALLGKKGAVGHPIACETKQAPQTADAARKTAPSFKTVEKLLVEIDGQCRFRTLRADPLSASGTRGTRPGLLKQLCNAELGCYCHWIRVLLPVFGQQISWSPRRAVFHPESSSLLCSSGMSSSVRCPRPEPRDFGATAGCNSGASEGAACNTRSQSVVAWCRA